MVVSTLRWLMSHSRTWRFCFGFFATVVISLIWYAGLAWELSPEEFWARIRIDVTFAICHPTVFACSFGAFLSYLDDRVVDRVLQFPRWALWALFLGPILIALLGTIVDFATRATVSYQLRSRPVDMALVLKAPDGGDLRIDGVVARVRPIEIDDSLRRIFGNENGNSGQFARLKAIFVAWTAAPGTKMFNVINVAGAAVCLLTWIFFTIIIYIIVYTCVAMRLSWSDSDNLRRVYSPRFVLTVGVLGLWFFFRPYTDYWNAYYLPGQPDLNPALVVIFFLWCAFIIFVLVVYVQRWPDKAGAVTDVLKKTAAPFCVAVFGILNIVPNAPQIGIYRFIERALSDLVVYAGVFAICLILFFALGIAIASSPDGGTEGTSSDSPA